MESLQDRDGCLASPLARVGVGIGLLGVLLVLFFVFVGLGDDDDDPPAEANETPTERAESGTQSIELADGQTLDIDLYIAPTAQRTIIAAPSRNADRASITPVGEALAGADCANVIAFDAQSVDARPISLYEALFELLLDQAFGDVFGDGFGTLGASFTGLPSWQAARDAGGTYNFVFAPSDPFPDDFSADAVPMSSLVIGEGDSGFLPQFEQWQAAGFDGATVPGAEHGSALFTGSNPAEALETLQTRLCF